MENKIYLILFIISFLTSISQQFDIEFSDSPQDLDFSGNKKFSFIAKFDSSLKKKYLYIYPKNFPDEMNSSILKIYFKQIPDEESGKNLNLNYLNSDYSTIDFNSGLFIKISELKYDFALISIVSDENCNLMGQYRYSEKISFPQYFKYSNFQLNQLILDKEETLHIDYNLQQAQNDYLLILSKTSLRNIEVKVTYKNKDDTKSKLNYLYPNGCSVFLDRNSMDENSISFDINNKNNRKEILLLGYAHHRKGEIFTNTIINGFQIYLEGNKNELDNLLISGKSNLMQYLTYQIFNKNLQIDFLTTDGRRTEIKEITEYNSMFPFKIDYEGRFRFEFVLSPQRSAIYFQYLDYSNEAVAQKSLQPLVTGVPKSMLIPQKKSMYHFLPIEIDSKNLFFYLRPKTKETIYASFESCTSYPDNCYINKKITNSIIQNIGLWYELQRNNTELQLIYVYCEQDCAYDILMTYEDNEPLFLFPDNNYTKFISDSNTDMFALPVFEYFETSGAKSLYIDLMVISGKAKLTLKDSKDGNLLNYEMKTVGKKQTYNISSDIFLKDNNYYKKEIYAIVTQEQNSNTFYNIMYGTGSQVNSKLLSNNIINIECLTVPAKGQESYETKIYNFMNYEKEEMFISISTKFCKSKVVFGDNKNEDYNHIFKVAKGLHKIEIFLINDDNLCKAGVEEEVILFTYHSNQEVLLSENTLINTTLSSTVSFLHLFKPNEKVDNSFNIEIEKFDLNELTFTYQIKKISFDGNNDSSEISGQKITSNKNRYISNSQINNYCGDLKKNEICSLTMTLTPSTSSKISLNLNKNGRYYAEKLTEKSFISSVNNNNPKYFYIDIDNNNNLEFLINSYGQDLKVNYNVINKKQNDEDILPLKTTYNSGNQIKVPKNAFSSCSDFCRLYIGVASEETSNKNDISTPFFISYHYYDDENNSKNSIYLPFNYYVHYTFNDIKEINFYFFNTISNMKLTFDLSIIKGKENNASTVTAKITGATNLEIKSDSSTLKTITTKGQINVNIKPSDENAGVTFKLRVSSIGDLNIIPMISSYAEKCLEPPCYYLVDDLSLDNEEKSAYFYIPESESSIINYLELKYDQSISSSGQFTPSTGKIKRSNWYEYKIPVEDRSNILILKMITPETLYPSYYHNPNQVTLKYGEKRMFTIKRGSKDIFKIKINRETSGNYKYIVKLHSIMGNGVFSTSNKNYPLGFENAYKEDITIIFDNDKKYNMELEAVNKRYDNVDPNYDFVFTIECTIDSGKELKYPIIFDKKNSFNFYKVGNFEQFSFYLDKKEITSEDLNMNIKLYSNGIYEINSYFADNELNILKDKNVLDGKIHTFIQGEGFTFSKLEISSDILKNNESPYIIIQINANKDSESNIVQIDLYPYNMNNTNSIAADELYTQKLPSNIMNYQLLFKKSELYYGNSARINFILPSEEYQFAIAQTSDGQIIIKQNETELVIIDSNQKEGFIEEIINLNNNDMKYLSFNILLKEEKEKNHLFIITYQNHAFNEEYLYNHDNQLNFTIEGKEKDVSYNIVAIKPKYSTSKNILIIKAYEKDKVEKYSGVSDELKSLYLLFNSDIKPAFTTYKEVKVDANNPALKKISDNTIKAGEYYFIAVSVILDNGREQYIGYEGLSYEVEHTNPIGKIKDYLKNHIFASIVIIIIILFVLGIMVNICRAERKKGRKSDATIKIDLNGKMLEDKEGE